MAHHLAAGDRVTLQIVATTPAYATPRLDGESTGERRRGRWSATGGTAATPRFFQPGQVLESWIEGIGTIRNHCT